MRIGTILHVSLVRRIKRFCHRRRRVIVKHEMMDTKDLANTPAREPPEGMTSNLVDPYSFFPLMVGVIAVSLVLTTVAVGLRVYTRLRLVKSCWEERE